MTSSKTSVIEKLTARGWVSLNKFCVLADISYPTAMKMVEKGELQVTPVGGIKRVYQDEVERFLIYGSRKVGEGDKPSSATSENTN